MVFGGEFLCLILVIKLLVVSVMVLFILIFDEIDFGVFGDVVLKMGYILYDLSFYY